MLHHERGIRRIRFRKIELTDELQNKIRQTIRAHASPRLVPAKIVPVPDIPYTVARILVEVAVEKVIHNRVVSY